jgi:succinyl-diaminopimelate desuccinylase
VSPSESWGGGPAPRNAPGERLAGLTEALCAIPSVTGDEDACADHLERWLRARTSAEVMRHGKCVVARGPATGRPLLLLVGHTDTVPPKPGDRPPRREGTRLHGLGASDMKGGLAVMMALAEDLLPPGGPARATCYDLGWVFYDHEEGPWVKSGLGPLLDAVPWLRTATLAFCMEPSDNVVQLGCMGTIHARVRFTGRSAHSARPWQGDNAIHKAAGLLARLGAREPVDVVRDGFLFREVISATQASGGTARNVIPDRFELNLNLRFAPGRTIDEAVADIHALVAGEAEIEIPEAAPSGRVVGENPILRRFLAQNPGRLEAKQAWTDVARLAQVGVDAVNWGPGCAAQAHQADEYAEIPLLVDSWEALHRLVAPDPG